MRQLPHSLPSSCRLCDRAHLVFLVPNLPVSYLGLLEVGQILVIRNNLGPGLKSVEVLSLLLNCLDYCQHLLLGYGIVLFCACHFL